LKPLRINGQIRTKECRLVGKNNEQYDIVPIAKAREIALKEELDLVEISPNAKPPVCKVMDYGKHRYEQDKKESAARKKQKATEVREIRLRPDIGDNDFEVKLKQVKKFLSEKNKVKVVIMFKGREIAHGQLGWKLLERMMEKLKDLAVIESQPRLESNRMFLMLAPPKIKPQKKSGKEVQD
jgi:translation initiation factor IF-3